MKFVHNMKPELSLNMYLLLCSNIHKITARGQTYSFCGLLVLTFRVTSRSHEDHCSPVGLRGSCPCRRLSELKLEES